jgi:hypothetical protein
LEELLIRENIDIVLVSETHLKPGDTFKLHNCIVYRKDRIDSQKGGVAVLLRRHLAPSEILFNKLIFIEAIAIKIKLCGQGDGTMASAYKSSGKPLVNNETEFVMSYHNSVTLCGYQNCKNSLRDRRMGILMEKFSTSMPKMGSKQPNPHS